MTQGFIPDVTLDEISGLAASRLHADILYVLNDSGAKPKYVY